MNSKELPLSKLPKEAKNLLRGLLLMGALSSAPSCAPGEVLGSGEVSTEAPRQNISSGENSIVITRESSPFTQLAEGANVTNGLREENQTERREKIEGELFFLPVDFGQTVTPEITREYQAYIQNQGQEVDWQELAKQSLAVAAISEPGMASYSVYAYRLQRDGSLIRDQGADVVKASTYQDSDGWNSEGAITQPLDFSWFNSEATQIAWPMNSVFPLPISEQNDPKKHLYALIGLTAVGEHKHSIQIWQRVKNDQLP